MSCLNVNVFFDIPKVQQVDLLSQWLEIDDVAALDSSTCSQKWRPELLSLLRSPELSFAKCPSFREYLMDWIIFRKVTFTDIQMCTSELSDDIKRDSLLKILGPKLKRITITCVRDGFADEDDPPPPQTDHVIFDLTQHCHNLTKFSIMWAALDGSLSFLINANQLLEEVSLTTCTNVTTNVLKSIIRLPNLTGLYLYQSTVVDFTTVPVCEPNLQCEMLMGRYCKMKPNALSWLCQSMPNLLKLHVDVRTGAELVCIASHCRQVTLASITIDSGLLVAEARNIASHWQSIELLTLLRPFDKKHLPVCDESVALVFVDKCHSLLQLKLAPSDPATGYAGKSDYSFVVYNDTNAEISKTDNTRSRLTDLFVSSLSAQALVTLTQKCVYLNTLRIVRPAPVAVNADAAEFSLHHLVGTSIKSLVLVNCSNLDHSHLLPLQGMVKLVLCNVGSSTLRAYRLLNVCRQSPDLEELYIHNCPGVDSRFVLGALEQCPKLTHFDYSEKEQVTRIHDPSVSIMSKLARKSYPNLTHFNATF